MLRKIIVFGRDRFRAHSSPTLTPVFGDGGAFYIAFMGDGNHHFLIRNQRQITDIAVAIYVNICPAGIAITRFKVGYFLADNLAFPLFAGQNIV